MEQYITVHNILMPIYDASDDETVDDDEMIDDDEESIRAKNESMPTNPITQGAEMTPDCSHTQHLALSSFNDRSSDIRFVMNDGDAMIYVRSDVAFRSPMLKSHITQCTTADGSITMNVGRYCNNDHIFMRTMLYLHTGRCLDLDVEADNVLQYTVLFNALSIDPEPLCFMLPLKLNIDRRDGSLVDGGSFVAIMKRQMTDFSIDQDGVMRLYGGVMRWDRETSCHRSPALSLFAACMICTWILTCIECSRYWDIYTMRDDLRSTICNWSEDMMRCSLSNALVVAFDRTMVDNVVRSMIDGIL